MRKYNDLLRIDQGNKTAALRLPEYSALNNRAGQETPAKCLSFSGDSAKQGANIVCLTRRFYKIYEGS